MSFPTPPAPISTPFGFCKLTDPQTGKPLKFSEVEITPEWQRWLVRLHFNVENGSPTVLEGAGDDVFVNGADVVDPNFNDSNPDIPSPDYVNGKWQKVSNPVGGHVDDVSVYVPIRPDILYTECVVGSELTGTVNDSIIIPYGSTVGGSIGIQAVMPVRGWMRNITVTTTAAQANGLVSLMRLYKDAGDTHLVVSIPPGYAAGLFKNANVAIFVEAGEPFSFYSHAYGPTAGAVGAQNLSVGFAPIDNSAVIGCGIGNVTIPAASTRWCLLGTETLAVTEDDGNVKVPFACTVKLGFARTLTLQPATGDLTYTIKKNNVATALVTTVTGGLAAGVYSNISDTVTFAAGDLMNLEMFNNAATASTQLGFYVLDIVPAVGISQIITSRTSTAVAGAQTFRGTPFGLGNTAAANQHQMAMTRAGTLKNMYVRGDSASGGTWVVTAFKNGVATALTVTINSGDLTVADNWVSDLTHTVAYAKNDLLHFEAVHTGGGGGGDRLRQICAEYNAA